MFDQHICVLLEHEVLNKTDSQIKASQLVVPWYFETPIILQKSIYPRGLFYLMPTQLNCCAPKGHDSTISKTRDSKVKQTHFKSLC